MRTRFSINEHGELVSRDGEVLGRLTSLTIDRAGGTIGGVSSSSSNEENKKKETTPQPPKTARDVEVDTVWAHWEHTFGNRWQLDAKRRTMISKALDKRSVDTLKEAITGLSKSPHHNGENATSTKYIDLQYALKGRGAQSDESVIDRMAELGRSATKTAALDVDEQGVPQFARFRFEAMRRLWHNRRFNVNWQGEMERLTAEIHHYGCTVIFDSDSEPLAVEVRQ